MKKNQLLNIEDRIYTFSKIYNSIITYFAGWQSVSDLNIDGLFKEYIGKVIKVPDRYQFGLLMMEFLALFKNGNCNYMDSFITEEYGSPLGFKISFYDGKWIIKYSQIEELTNYEVINEIDGEDMESFFQRQNKYICSFNDREAKTKLSSHPFLFPQKFTLTLGSGKIVEVDRSNLYVNKNKLQTEGIWIKDGELGYIKIPSFESIEFEEKAVEFVNLFKEAKCIIIDLRENSGGIIPHKLIKILMDKPYRFWSESTPVSFGLFKNYGEKALQDDEESAQSIWRCFEQSSLMWPAFTETNFKNVFKGKISLLVDGTCSYTCEDFIIPFKDNKRASILGEKTMGCTGFPYILNFDNGINVSISSKKPFFPEGSAFEGVGISPDIGIHLTLEDLKNSRDGVLMEAIRMTNMFIR